MCFLLKDAHLRPPPTYNYELIDDEDGEGKFEQQQQEQEGGALRKNPAQNDQEVSQRLLMLSVIMR